MSEQNKAMLREIYNEAFNKGNLSVVDRIVAKEAKDHAAPPGLPGGPEGLKLLVGMFRGAFPDLHVTIHDVMAEGDRVIARYTITGTHKGEFSGLKATGKKVSFGGIDIVRFANGKAVEHWGNQDDLGMLGQLGIHPHAH